MSEHYATADMAVMVRSIARLLVTKPEAVDLKTRPAGDGAILLDLVVDENDVSRIVGRKGQTIAALRRIVEAAASMQGLRAQLSCSNDVARKGSAQ